jgi:hypothetical protein
VLIKTLDAKVQKNASINLVIFAFLARGGDEGNAGSKVFVLKML